MSKIATLKFYLAYGKRFMVALRDTWRPAQASYAQHGEDVAAQKLLQDYDLRQGIYVEIGANQPTQISNTYLFYRQGLHGVVVEPSRVVTPLLRMFRPRDVCVEIGCGAESGVLPFNISHTSVLSSFTDGLENNTVLRQEFVPVLPLDVVLRQIPAEWIYYLSIDTEGFDLNVLQGAVETLQKTYLVNVEAYGEEEGVNEFLLNQGYECLERVGYNLLYRNTKSFARFLRTGHNGAGK
jgi:FkbM family methyltransferase